LLCSPCWPWTWSPSATISQVLELQVCTTPPSLIHIFKSGRPGVVMDACGSSNIGGRRIVSKASLGRMYDPIQKMKAKRTRGVTQVVQQLSNNLSRAWVQTSVPSIKKRKEIR
jgi:hypothetical protein